MTPDLASLFAGLLILFGAMLAVGSIWPPDPPMLS